jgi:hypothetical protein
MLADIGARTQHPGRRFQLVNQNGVIVFTAGEVDGFPGSQVQRFQMRRGNVDDIQRRQRFLSDGNKFGGQR